MAKICREPQISVPFLLLFLTLTKTDFDNSFNVIVVDKLRRKMVYNLAPLLKSVAALYLAQFECSNIHLYSRLLMVNIHVRWYVFIHIRILITAHI